MTRSTARELAVHFSYELIFGGSGAEEAMSRLFDDPDYFSTLKGEYEIYSEMPDVRSMAYLKNIVTGVYEHALELDSYIEKYARGWKFDRISRIAAAIMRVAMFEILYVQDVPSGAAANEAVEIAKKYETEETAAFINGILGSFIKNEIQA
ncbi:MAG: transcription antitermination factor NusB [Oscillospiraceae bacterium]|jgi:N utilization substance protein B